MNRNHVPVDGTQKAASLYEDLGKDLRETSDTQPFTTGKGGSLPRFRDGFGLKSTNITERERPHSLNFHSSVL